MMGRKKGGKRPSFSDVGVVSFDYIITFFS